MFNIMEFKLKTILKWNAIKSIPSSEEDILWSILSYCKIQNLDPYMTSFSVATLNTLLSNSSNNDENLKALLKNLESKGLIKEVVKSSKWKLLPLK